MKSNLIYTLHTSAISLSVCLMMASLSYSETFTVNVQRNPGDEWKPFETQTIEKLDGYRQSSDPQYSTYGGILASQYQATGFFYTQKIKGRWWLIDPDGHLFVHKAINCVNPGQGENAAKAREKKFGTQEGWAESTTRFFHELGFNGSSAWSKDELTRNTSTPLAYCPINHFVKSYAKKAGGRKGVSAMMMVLDPEFEKFADQMAKPLAATKNDPWLLGHFSDNEIRWNNKGILLSCLKAPKDDPVYQAAYTWLKQRKGTKKVDTSDVTPEDIDAFYEYHADRYFRIVSSAIKKYDPNHLYIGCRMKKNDANNQVLLRTAGKYVDIFSYNWYRQWTPNPDMMNRYSEWSGKPFLVSEFYAKGSHIPGLTNTGGIGWVVKTQQDRGYFYQTFVLGLLGNKNCVGWHWFRYDDNDPENAKADPSNRDSNKGIVNIEFEPYEPLTSQMQKLNKQAYRLIEFFDGTLYTDAETN